jgi:hypothetical protein
MNRTLAQTDQIENSNSHWEGAFAAGICVSNSKTEIPVFARMTIWKSMQLGFFSLPCCRAIAFGKFPLSPSDSCPNKLGEREKTAVNGRYFTLPQLCWGMCPKGGGGSFAPYAIALPLWA